ncbi:MULTISPECIES: DUF4870 domain-containing protein [Paenibacillus]|uniref:DUF4870 domain-containing protein n=1 Tax=Paenibacillus radicis (ex Xue et al. 2023) TaxID=2972489 RepID=A0ABT1YU63_9BACL|nr:DUF4870 domain-containing protein [Paenibacillus radicis (ex Xue et al. 2023)]MCR8636714.1 DUF4870 domain-containing protein [Paenibacillus radicis (ex Xue et al. 2023)]
MATSDERTMALLSHILCIVVGFLAPLIIWLIKKDQSQYVDEHAKESLNFQISITIYSIIASVLMVVLIGFVLLPAIIVFMYVFCIIATIKANNGEMYRYPLTIRLIK